jgi:hypothetical protein
MDKVILFLRGLFTYAGVKTKTNGPTTADKYYLAQPKIGRSKTRVSSDIVDKYRSLSKTEPIRRAHLV